MAERVKNAGLRLLILRCWDHFDYERKPCFLGIVKFSEVQKSQSCSHRCSHSVPQCTAVVHAACFVIEFRVFIPKKIRITFCLCIQDVWKEQGATEHAFLEAIASAAAACCPICCSGFRGHHFRSLGGGLEGAGCGTGSWKRNHLSRGIACVCHGGWNSRHGGSSDSDSSV
jgi:hypothetical protein